MTYEIPIEYKLGGPELEPSNAFRALTKESLIKLKLLSPNTLAAVFRLSIGSSTYIL